MLDGLRWWLAISALGWITWPIVRPIFRHTPGQGLAHARAIALVCVSYAFWLPGVLGLIPNTTGWLWVVVGGWALLGIGCAIRQRGELTRWLRANWRHALAIELLFALTMGLYAWHRAYDPAITHTEQPMDLALLNGILASPRLPPRDPWLSGFAISYYYLGHFVVAALVRLTGVPSGVGYNLGLAHTLALFVVGLYGTLTTLCALFAGQRPAPRVGRLGARVSHPRLILGAICVALVGNLATLVELPALASGVLRSGMRYLAQGERWWWWRASRVIQDHNLLGRNPTVITEFPAFSLILGDLHPHVMALPYTLVALGLAVVLYTWGQHPEARPARRSLLLLPLLIGALGFLNSWDLPTYLGLALVAYAAGRWRRGDRGMPPIRDIALMAGYLGGASLLLYLPFYLGLQSQVQGIGLAYYAKTSLDEFLLVWGGFLLPLLGDAALSGRRMARVVPRLWRKVVALGLALFLLPWIVTGALGGLGRLLIGVLMLIQAGPWVLLLQSGLLALFFVDAWDTLRQPKDVKSEGRLFVRLLVLTGLALTYVVEIVYLRDLFDTRMNTVFKFSYQAWVLLGIGAMVALERLWRAGRAWRGLSMASAALLAVCLYYPVAAGMNKADGYRGQPTLDGTAYLEAVAPEAHRLVLWLREHAQPEDVLVEAPGASYDASTNRFSTLTGIPTALGWPGHQVQWRGDERLVRERQALVEAIFTAEGDRLLALLQEVDATYLVVDPHAIALYDLTQERIEAFDAMLALRLAEGPYRLYRVPGPQRP